MRSLLGDLGWRGFGGWASCGVDAGGHGRLLVSKVGVLLLHQNSRFRFHFRLELRVVVVVVVVVDVGALHLRSVKCVADVVDVGVDEDDSAAPQQYQLHDPSADF